MKKITILIILALNLSCFGQTNLKATLDSAILRIKQISLYSSTGNWDSIQKQAYLKAENAKTVNDLKPAFEAILNALKDHHGSVLNAKNYSTIARFTDYEHFNHPDTRVRANEIWKVVNDTAQRFEYKILKDNIAYVKIVGIAPNVDIEKEAQKIRNAIIELYTKKIDKWIIDLRYNGGGNMNPMMSGLGPLIGDGIVGKLMNLKGETINNWEIKNGNFVYMNSQFVTLKNTPKFKTLPKVAVLISKWTVSSGELVATAFKGRPNTKFFGEASGSYTTNNSWDLINNDVILSISTAIFGDRNGTIYKYNIPVDVEIPFEVITDKEKDNCIISAKEWLSEKK